MPIQEFCKIILHRCKTVKKSYTPAEMRECLFYWYSVFCLFWHGFSAYIGHLTQSVKKLYTGNEEFYCNIQEVYNGNGDEFRRPCPCLYGIYGSYAAGGLSEEF